MGSSGKELLPRTYPGNTGFEYQGETLDQFACLAWATLVVHHWWIGNWWESKKN